MLLERPHTRYFLNTLKVSEYAFNPCTSLTLLYLNGALLRVHYKMAAFKPTSHLS